MSENINDTVSVVSVRKLGCRFFQGLLEISDAVKYPIQAVVLSDGRIVQRRCEGGSSTPWRLTGRSTDKVLDLSVPRKKKSPAVLLDEDAVIARRTSGLTEVPKGTFAI